MGEKRVTFKDIANHTGFSKTTISRYFNKPDYLTPENRQKISMALKELHYKENKVAQILARGDQFHRPDRPSHVHEFLLSFTGQVSAHL